MIKRVILFVILMLCTPVAFAGFWDAVGACFTDPCNCGDSNPTRWEDWDGQSLNKGDKNTLCPPWNKNGGRDDHTCLVKASFPGAWIGYYENLCGEETSDSTYFEPKIKVRGQQCNAVACWTTSDTLSWDGECVTLVGGYVFPLHRMCARVAMPADTDKDLPADPGYTYGQHLNFEGATKDDERIETIDGQTIIVESPKLCLYKDPSFFSIEDGFDVMDLNPNKQSFHKTSEIHPVIRVIIFFVDNLTTFAQAPMDMISGLIDSMGGGDDEDKTTFGSVLSDIFGFLSDVIGWVGDAIVAFLEAIGQINRAVDSKIYGCVNLPMGPFPPPYCESVSPFFQVAIAQRVCQVGSDGAPVQSVETKECVVSTLRNNYIHNAIRVGYETFVPLCASGKDPTTTDKCVTIENLDSFASASVLHTMTGRKDIIKKCEDAQSGEPCVRTMIPHTCSVTANGCQDGFRVVYAKKVGSVTNSQSYYRDDLDDCPSSTSATCQQIWGVNTGEFVDVSLAFDAIQSSYDIAPLSIDFELVDKGNREAYFIGLIVRLAGYNSDYNLNQTTNEFCVVEGDIVVGCIARADAPRATVSECASNSVPGITCTSSYFSPQFVVSYNSQYKTDPDSTTFNTDSTSALVTPDTVYNPGSTMYLNLAGDEFQAFVTDDTFVVKPFSGLNSPNPSSIFGVYKDNVLPVANATVNPYAVYLSGLEYINGRYALGGKNACLSYLNQEKCPDNPKLCVLTKLLNKNTVSCSTFAQKNASSGGLSTCTPSQITSCSVTDSMSKIGGGSISIRSCSDGKKCYEWSVDLCKPSTLLADRVDPAASIGLALRDDQYRDTSASTSSGNPSATQVNYDPNNEALRDKTSAEMGLCVNVPQGSCGAQNNYSSQDNGYASWPGVDLGADSLGTCQPGWSPASTLTRKCIPYPDTQTFGLEPVYMYNAGPLNIPVKTYNDVKCIQNP